MEATGLVIVEVVTEAGAAEGEDDDCERQDGRRVHIFQLAGCFLLMAGKRLVRRVTCWTVPESTTNRTGSFEERTSGIQ